MELSYLLYVIGTVGVILLGLVAFRVVTTFDFNKWQERNDEKMRIRLKNACPHFLISYKEADGKPGFGVQSLIITTYGTTDWFCTQCQLVFPGGLLCPPPPNNWEELKAIMELQEKYRKLVRKAGYK